MKNFLSIALKQFLFWLLYFFLLRLLFVTVHFRRAADAGLTDVMLSFIHALPLDVSAAAYIISLPLVLLTLAAIFSAKFIYRAVFAYNILIIITAALVYAGEIMLYDEWNAKINYKIFMHLQNPMEPLRTATVEHIFLFTFSALISIISGIWLYSKYFYPRFSSIPSYGAVKRILLYGGATLLLVPFVALSIRGGWQPIPISQSSIYFSKHIFANDVAVNSLWNLGHSISENRKNFKGNPYAFMDKGKAHGIAHALYTVEKDSTEKVLSNTRPNIVMFILESWSADVIGCLSGGKSSTPFFDSLASQGILFTQFYASGWTSDLGMGAILSGYPAMPIASIITQGDKYRKINCINRPLQQEGYNTSFYFGGELNYGNIKGYLVDHGFGKVMEGKDFPSSLPRGRLGIHDEYMLTYHLEELNKTPQPFFSAVFTLSSHAPYDMPVQKKLDWGDDENEYVNSVYYTDRCLASWFEEAKKQEWYDNTLVVIVADHSHRSPQKRSFASREYQHIPLLFAGNVIEEKYRGHQYTGIASQTDIASTLLSQMGLPTGDFRWSRNLFNPHIEEFAFYIFYDGFGWIRPEGYFAFENRYQRYYFEELRDSSARDRMIEEGQAYIQDLFEEYMGL